MELGPTVDGTSDYAFPDCIRLIRLSVGTIPWARTSLESIEDAAANLGFIEYVTGGGVYAPTTDATGAELLRLYPTPSQDGLPILAETVGKPPAYDTGSLSDTTVFPDDFDRAQVDYARAIYFGSVEDNAALRSYYMDRADENALELRRERTGRMGSGPRRIPIIGVTG